MVSVASHRAPVRESLQMSATVVSGVASGEPAIREVVVHEMEVAFPVSNLSLDSVAFENIKPARQHKAPAKHAVVAQRLAIRAHITKDSGELHVTDFGFLP